MPSEPSTSTSPSPPQPMPPAPSTSKSPLPPQPEVHGGNYVFEGRRSAAHMEASGTRAGEAAQQTLASPLAPRLRARSTAPRPPLPRARAAGAGGNHMQPLTSSRALQGGIPGAVSFTLSFATMAAAEDRGASQGAPAHGSAATKRRVVPVQACTFCKKIRGVGCLMLTLLGEEGSGVHCRLKHPVPVCCGACDHVALPCTMGKEVEAAAAATATAQRHTKNAKT